MTKKRQQKMTREFRIFSIDQRKKVVQEIEQGLLTKQQALDKYNIVDSATLRSWILHHAKDATKILNSKPTPLEKRKAVYRIINGEATVNAIAAEMMVSVSSVFKWVKEIKSEIAKPAITLPIISGRESEIDSLKLKVASLETMIDIAEKELKIDIRKKSGTKQ
jgi:transposase